MTGRRRTTRNVDLEFEQYVLQELPAAEMARVEAQAAADPAVRARLDELHRSALDIAARYPAAVMAAGIRQRLEASRAPGAAQWLSWHWPAVAGMAVLAVLALAAPLAGPSPSGGPPDRTKGAGPALLVYRWAPQGAEVLASGAVASPGDRLRIGYRADGRRFGAIVSADGTGLVTQHLPAAGDWSVELAADAVLRCGGRLLSEEQADRPNEQCAGGGYVTLIRASTFVAASLPRRWHTLPSDRPSRISAQRTGAIDVQNCQNSRDFRLQISFAALRSSFVSPECTPIAMNPAVRNPQRSRFPMPPPNAPANQIKSSGFFIFCKATARPASAQLKPLPK